MKSISFLVILLSVLMMSACSHVQSETHEGVIVAYGNTSVQINTNPEPAAKHHYRDATPELVAEVLVEMSCQYPEGPSDLERQSFISVSLDLHNIDPDSFQKLFVMAVADVDFANRLEEGMQDKCPAALDEILASAYQP